MTIYDLIPETVVFMPYGANSDEAYVFRSNAESLSSMMDGELANVLWHQLVPGFFPDILNPERYTSTFVERIVLDLGPMFVVLDGVRRGFASDDRDDKASWDLFKAFCDEVLVQWMQIKELFFVILGYAPFLRYAPSGLSRPNSQATGVFYSFTRLRLYLIPPNKIDEILVKTRVHSTNVLTLQERWGLQQDDQLKEATKLLFEKSFGHPRILWKLLNEFDDCNDFLQHNEDVDLDVKSWSVQYRGQWSWRKVIRDWLPSAIKREEKSNCCRSNCEFL